MNMTEPNRITRLRDLANDLYKSEACEHGHFDCAHRDGGMCSNEAAVEVMVYEDAHGLPRTTIPEDEA